jgi:hypothetical protein
MMTTLVKNFGGQAVINDFDTIANTDSPALHAEYGKNMANAIMAQRPEHMSEYEFAHRAQDFVQDLIWENFSNSNLVHTFQFCIMELKSVY